MGHWRGRFGNAKLKLGEFQPTEEAARGEKQMAHVSNRTDFHAQSHSIRWRYGGFQLHESGISLAKPRR